MKKFKFRMNALYKLRVEEEKQALRYVSELRMQEADLNAQIDETKLKRSSWMDVYNEATKQYEDGEKVLMIEQYLFALESRRIHLEQILTELKAKIREALAAWERTFRARRQVEFIRDKNVQEYQYQLKKDFEKETDEMSSIRYVRAAEHGDL